MDFPFKRPLSSLVLFSFFFQTLWPSVAFARVEVPLGAAWQEDPCGLTFQVSPFEDPVSKRPRVRVQAFANPREEWHQDKGAASLPTTSPSTVSSPESPFTSKPGSASSSLGTSSTVSSSSAKEFQKLLDRVVDIRDLRPVPSESARALYQDLTVTEAGMGWSFGGLVFALDWQWNVVTTGSAGFDMAVKIHTQGTVSLDNVTVKQVLAQGRELVLRGTGRIERLDAWATPHKGKPGVLRVTEGSHQTVKELLLHQGQGENLGHLTIEDSLEQTETFENKGTLVLNPDAHVQGGKVFTNHGRVEGTSYTLQSDVIRNQGKGTQKALLQASQKVTLVAKKLEQKGQLIAPGVDLSQVEQIEESSSALLQAEQLKTQVHKDWTIQGQVEAKTWQDTSKEAVFIKNQGTVITHQETSLKARYRTLKGGKSDLTGVRFHNAQDRYQPLVNEGDVTLRKVQTLGGYHQDIENKAGASLIFLDGGYSSPYARDPNGVPRWGGLHLGKVNNAGTIGFGNGTYRLHGVLTQTETGIHEVLPGQELWAKDILNDGVANAPYGYRLDQRLALFTKLGKIRVKGQLITQISEQAVRHKTGGTTYPHKDHFEAEDWVDESDPTVTIENRGTLITRKSATVSAQFFTGQGGTSDLRGVSLAAPLIPDQPLVNHGTTILRQVQSLGSSYRPILNQPGGKLAFVEGSYSQTAGDSSSGGLTMGAVTNAGVISFGGGEYYTGVFLNHHIQEALGGQKLWVKDLINHGELRSDKGYRIDMSRGLFTKLGKVVVTGGGPTTILFPQGVNAGLYLTDQAVPTWELEGPLQIYADRFHNVADWLLKGPFYLWTHVFLNDAAIHTYGFFLESKTFAQGTLGHRLGVIKSQGALKIDVEGDVDNRRGQIEAEQEGEVISKNGDIAIGQPMFEGEYLRRNGAFILSAQNLRLKGRSILACYGDVGSKGRLELDFLTQMLVESGIVQASTGITFSGPGVLVRKRSDWYPSSGLYAFHPKDAGGWDRVDGYGYSYSQRVIGQASQILSGGFIRFLVDHLTVVASDIAAMGDITDKHGHKRTQRDLGYFKLFPLEYYVWVINPHRGPMRLNSSLQCAQLPTFSGSGRVDLNFACYHLADLLFSAASARFQGESFLLGLDRPSGIASGGAIGGRLPLLPAILKFAGDKDIGCTGAGGMVRYQTPQQNPYVVYSTGSFRVNILDPKLLTLVSQALTTSPVDADPTRDVRVLRQIVDQDALVWALQVTLLAATRKGYLFAKKGAQDHLRLLLENAQKQKHPLTLTGPAPQEPSLFFEKETVQGEAMLVPYLYVPQDYINTHLFEDQHGVMAVEEGIKVKMDRFLGVKGGVMATHKKNIDLQGQDVLLAAAADTHTQGKHSYQTKSGGAFYVEEHGKLKVQADGDLKRQGITVQTSQGATFKAQGKGVDEALPMHSHTVTNHGDGQTVTHRVNHAVSTYRLGEGVLKEQFDGTLDTYAQDVEAKAAYTQASHVTEHAVYDTVHQTIHRQEKGGLFGSGSEVHEEIRSSTSKGSVFKLKRPRVITATHGNILLEGVHYQVPRVILNAPNGAIQILARTG